jgi:ribosome maturation factor RimP
MGSPEDIAAAVKTLADPIAESIGLEVVLVQYRRETDGWVLRVLLDREGGVTVTDCGTFSRELSDVMDGEDPIPNRYRLEVSSPGLDRPLVSPKDFERFAGAEVAIQTTDPVEGRSHFRGILRGMEDNHVLIDVDNQRFEIRWPTIKKANLVPELASMKARSGRR